MLPESARDDEKAPNNGRSEPRAALPESARGEEREQLFQKVQGMRRESSQL